jgi:hypothetical protein
MSFDYHPTVSMIANFVVNSDKIESPYNSSCSSITVHGILENNRRQQFKIGGIHENDLLIVRF